MKRKSFFAYLLLACSFLFILTFASQALAAGKVQSFTGRVTGVDAAGKGIAVETGTGKATLIVGAIVTPETVLIVKGKKMPIGDLTKEVKPGDTVVLKIERTTDLYAKEISKK